MTFEPLQERFWTTGADVTLDTRRDPAYPSDAVLASATWSRLNAIGATSFGASGRRSIATASTRAATSGCSGQNVLAVARRVRHRLARRCRRYEQWLLGGSNLRGTPAGEFAGDKRFLWSAELRVPFSSPLSTGRTRLQRLHGRRRDRAPTASASSTSTSLPQRRRRRSG